NAGGVLNQTGSEGLYDFCKRGVNLTLTTGSTLDREGLNSYLRAHDRLRGEMELMLHAGYDMSAQFDELLNSDFGAVSQGIQYANFNGGLTEEQGIAMGFN
ncbi:hypothetical protein RZS08_65445, partial [Arthrospira platensis SPKY1]|nr:hypothetical protein [Arthrospira platensis SPKY1]